VAASTFFDSGSNSLAFADSSLPACAAPLASFYCPASPLALVAQVTGVDGATKATVNFTVNNVQSISAGDDKFALPGFASAGTAVISHLFDFGLPFFYGRHVYFGYPSASATPYVAF
jgi:Protein of unknown function (DUF3443)